MTAGGKLQGREEAQMGGGEMRREVAEERETRRPGRNLQPFLFARVSDGRDHGSQTGANRSTGGRGQDRRGKDFKTPFLIGESDGWPDHRLDCGRNEHERYISNVIALTATSPRPLLADPCRSRLG